MPRDNIKIADDFYQLETVYERVDDLTVLVHFFCMSLDTEQYYWIHTGSLGTAREYEDYKQAMDLFLMILKGESPKHRSQSYPSLKEACKSIMLNRSKR